MKHINYKVLLRYANFMFNPTKKCLRSNEHKKLSNMKNISFLAEYETET